MKAPLAVGSILFVFVSAATIANLLKASARPYPKRWQVLQDGPVKGVAWMSLKDDRLPEEVGPNSDLSWWISEPNDFIYRLPSPATKADAYVVTPDGDEVLITEHLRFDRPEYRSIAPFREYPPNLEHLDVVIRPQELPPSRFRLRDLPPTRLLFPVDGSEVRAQTVNGLRLEAVAWTPTSAPTQTFSPRFAVAVGLPNGYPDGETWEWRHLKAEHPFVGPKQEPTAQTSVSRRAGAEEYGIGVLQTSIWAAQVPRVRVQGALSHFLQAEETLDLGEVEVEEIQDRLEPNQDFQLRQSGPLVVRTASGYTLRLLPMRGGGVSRGGSGSRLHMRGVLEADAFPSSLRTAKGEREVYAWIASERDGCYLPAEPTKPGDHARIDFWWPGLRPGRHRIRLHVRFRVADREYPFDLRPNVQHRDLPPPQLGTGSYAGWPVISFFDPTPETFGWR